MIRQLSFLALLRVFVCSNAPAQQLPLTELPRLLPGNTGMQNALWIENPLTARFNTSRRVVVADIKGPGVITMIHFAMPQRMKLNRDLLIRAYFDGEKTPSVDCPFVDFFCDPAGTRAEVVTQFVTKRRGYNAFFPMPFRRSARLELLYEGKLKPGAELWRSMPAYSYVMYQTLKEVPRDWGIFHAQWRKENVVLGKRDYTALEATGRGKFLGWCVTVRLPGRTSYPVDENEKFFLDGEATPSVEFQGIEDSFGFSWGFPPKEAMYPRYGFFPFFKGACAYRFFTTDAISFRSSLRVTIGFGAKENPVFPQTFGKPENALHFSSVAYWYQEEPHKAFPPMPAPEGRAPVPDEPQKGSVEKAAKKN